ncbi:MAG: ATPase [Marivirga sp.]|nr:ATPase [Marivirga sp.]
MERKNEVVITRIFNAPRKLVWKAWTNPKHMMRWWGPKDFTSPSCKIDFRIGGKYLYCMRSSDGRDFWSTGTYGEIVPLGKIVCTDSFSDEKGNVVHASKYGMADDFPMELEVTLLFEEVDGKTRLTLQHVGMPAGEMKEMTATGWNESLDKLAETLNDLTKKYSSAITQ